MKMVFKWSVTFGNSYHRKKEKWKVVAGNLIELFSDPLHGAPFYFLTGGFFFIIGLLLLSMGMGWLEID